MDEIKNYFNRFCNAMEKNNRGVHISCYSISLIGLGIAIKRVRPFSRFKKPTDVPDHFIKEKKELNGLVKRIEPNGGLLMVHHKPLITLPGIISGGGELPVKISGVNVTGLGINWLQTIVAGNQVKFIPITKDKNYIQCEVLLPQTTTDNKLNVINIGESLIKIGFGNVNNIDNNDLKNKYYFNKLLIAENYALRKKLGMLYYMQPVKHLLFILIKTIQRFAFMSIKKIVKLPKLAIS